MQSIRGLMEGGVKGLAFPHLFRFYFFYCFNIGLVSYILYIHNTTTGTRVGADNQGSLNKKVKKR